MRGAQKIEKNPVLNMEPRKDNLTKNSKCKSQNALRDYRAISKGFSPGNPLDFSG